MWDSPVARSEKDPPPANAPGAGWRHVGGEREWRWGGRDVSRGGIADGYVHGRAGGGGHVWGTYGGRGAASRALDVVGGGGTVTPLVLHHKSFTKICHEHHVYVLMHVIKCVDQFM